METVSVIVPVYQAEKWLERCIESILSQTYSDLEVLLIDDGSRDASGRICDAYARQDSRITVLHQENKGLVAARKAGILAAVGAWIYYVDADDYIEKNTIESMLQCAGKYKCDVVAAGVIRESKDGRQKELNKCESGFYENDRLSGLYRKMLCSEEYVRFGIQQYLWNKLFRKEVLMDSQLAVHDDITCGEDVACLYPALLHAERIYVMEQAFYHYVMHTESMTASQTSGFFANARRIYDVLERAFTASEYKNILLPQLELYMIYMMEIAKTRLVKQNAPASAGKVREENIVFPFWRIPKNSRIILYGAGKYGRIYQKQIIFSGYCQVAAWMDRYAKDKIRPEEIGKYTYDYVVIALKDGAVCKEVRRVLTEMGVAKNKIIWEIMDEAK